MPEPLLDIKLAVLSRKRKIKNLADDMGIRYDRTLKILGGFENPPLGFIMQARRIIAQWDETDMAIRAVMAARIGPGAQDEKK